MDTDRDLYQILQVDPAAEQEVVQAAFRRLASKYHPDKNSSEDAHRRMQELNEAYAVIGDPVKRAAYDQQRQIALTAQRHGEDEARQRADAERRAEAARQRKEQMAAQRHADNQRREAEQAASAQRRAEYEQRIREQMAAQRKAKREKQQREYEAQQARDRAAAQAATATPIEPVKPIEPEPEPSVVPPIEVPQLTESERHQMALIQSRRALQNEIFKVDYSLTDAVERLKYWNTRRIPWEVSLLCGQRTAFIVGGLVTFGALMAAVLGLSLEGHIAWLVWAGVSLGAVWWTWRNCLSIVPVRSFVDAWSTAKHAHELQLKHLQTELAQLEAAMQTDERSSEE
ncbi:MAG: DnaJ domain-containing protein [Anaerolineae bacterium]